jgi:hypothetical protein
MNHEEQDILGGTAGLATIGAWIMAHQTAVGFVFASCISVLTAVYLIQGIIIRNKEIRNLKKD